MSQSPQTFLIGSWVPLPSSSLHSFRMLGCQTTVQSMGCLYFKFHWFCFTQSESIFIHLFTASADVHLLLYRIYGLMGPSFFFLIIPFSGNFTSSLMLPNSQELCLWVWWDDSTCKGTCYWVWWPEFCLPDPRGERKEWTSASRLLTYECISWHTRHHKKIK